MTIPLIQTDQLCKTYRNGSSEVNAVDHIDLHITEGEFTAIVGPSGSGKTTLLHLLGGLECPTSGHIRIDGRDIGLLTDKELVDFRLHHIGFVFQAYNLIPVLTIEENISFLMELQGIPREERKRRARELMEVIGLADRARSRPNTLSGGQQQRVAVARALASKPRFVLADEPTANLDTRSAEKLLDMMTQLNNQEQVTFVFSTHDPRIIARARRIITLEDGKIVSDL